MERLTKRCLRMKDCFNMQEMAFKWLFEVANQEYNGDVRLLQLEWELM